MPVNAGALAPRYDTGVTFEFDETTIPVAPDEILDVAAVSAIPSAWLVTTRTGRLIRIERQDASEIGQVTLPIEKPQSSSARNQHTPRLYASGNGRFVAVVNDYGRRGVIYDTLTERATLELDGGEYYSGTVPFSFCFIERDGRTLAVHRTDWNRLDVSDAESGSLLTRREAPESHGDEHYLDYFHGRLLASPNGHYVVDDGWIWHPIGVPTTWNVAAWLNENIWESEDGATRLELCARVWYWDHAMCWLDDNRVVIGGIGEHGLGTDRAPKGVLDGARVFCLDERAPWQTEVYSGDGAREVLAFEGPSGRFFGEGDRLFAASDRGLEIWDVTTGSRLGEVASFVPSRQHRSGRELIERSGSVLRRWLY
jgi:hypothetical protein